MRPALHEPPLYRPDIDGLRAVAVLAVVGFHAFPGHLGAGFVGVDIFFVISGFLISSVILKNTMSGAFSFTTFYVRRVQRIFPALILVLGFALAFGWRTLLGPELEQLAGHVAAGAGFVVNFSLWRESGYFDETTALKPLMHLWSLAIEEQFYLTYPLLLWLSWRSRIGTLRVLLVLGVASFVANVWLVFRNPGAAFFLPVSRFWELIVGGALACHTMAAGRGPGALAPARRPDQERRARRFREFGSALGMLLMCSAMGLLTTTQAFPGGWALLPTAGAALLIWAGRDTWINRAILGHRLVVFVGLISYPLYLWHWVLLSFARIASSNAPSAAVRMLAVLASCVLASLTYLLVDKPIRFGRPSRAKPLLLCVVLAAVGLAGLAVFRSHGVPSRFPPSLRALGAMVDYEFRSDANVGTCWLGEAQPGHVFAGSCIEADDERAPRPLILVWGDSHAARLSPGIRNVQKGFRVGQFTRNGCRPVLYDGYENCQRGNAFVLATIRQVRPDTVVLFAAWTTFVPAGSAGSDEAAKLRHTIALVKGSGVRSVVVVGPAPHWNCPLPRNLFNVYRNAPSAGIPDRTSFGLLADVEVVDRWLANAVADQGVTYVSAWHTLCTRAGCLARTGADPSTLTSWDYGHLTTSGAEVLARALPWP